MTDNDGRMLLTAKERYYPAWRRFDVIFAGVPKWGFFVILFIPYWVVALLLVSFLGIQMGNMIHLFILASYFFVLFLVFFIDVSACSIYSVERRGAGKIVPLKRIKRIEKLRSGIRVVQSGYKIMDASKIKQASFQVLPVDFQAWSKRAVMITHLEIESRSGDPFRAKAYAEKTPSSAYKGYYKPTEVTVTGLKERPVFRVTTMGWGKGFQIEVQRQVEMVLMFALSIRFIYCFLTKQEHYDHTPSIYN
ncbi:MAG: hypothetical protein ACFFE8_17175 [Candidatus Heimdallarchaeota archaeon]